MLDNKCKLCDKQLGHTDLNNICSFVSCNSYYCYPCAFSLTNIYEFSFCDRDYKCDKMKPKITFKECFVCGKLKKDENVYEIKKI